MYAAKSKSIWDEITHCGWRAGKGHTGGYIKDDDRAEDHHTHFNMKAFSLIVVFAVIAGTYGGLIKSGWSGGGGGGWNYGGLSNSGWKSGWSDGGGGWSGGGGGGWSSGGGWPSGGGGGWKSGWSGGGGSPKIIKVITVSDGGGWSSGGWSGGSKYGGGGGGGWKSGGWASDSSGWW